MNTIIKSSNGISLAPLESRLLSDRKLFIEGEDYSSFCLRIRKGYYVAGQRRCREAYRYLH